MTFIPATWCSCRGPRAASVQFAGRVIRVLPRVTYDGWCWIDGYVLGPGGGAVERRSLFVQLRGLIATATTPAPPRQRNTQRNRAAPSTPGVQITPKGVRL